MWILTLLLMIFILGIIILVHELGHFFWAKKFGVHIYEFSIGMGPILHTHKGKDKIDYNIRAIPIGGFVAMAGEVYEDAKDIKKEDFTPNVFSSIEIAILPPNSFIILGIQKFHSLPKYFKLNLKSSNIFFL